MKLKPYTGIRRSRVHNTFIAENVGLALNSFSIHWEPMDRMKQRIE